MVLLVAPEEMLDHLDHPHTSPPGLEEQEVVAAVVGVDMGLVVLVIPVDLVLVEQRVVQEVHNQEDLEVLQLQ
jgi:hypothetical protein